MATIDSRRQGGGLIERLSEAGFSFFASVPCSYLKKYIDDASCLAEERRLVHVSALREDNALGLACGAYFSGKHAVVMMQNSGFGASVNALASLVCAFDIPLLLLMTVRGCNEHDSPENTAMGGMTEGILQMLHIRTKIFDYTSEEEAVTWAKETVVDEGRVAALLSPCACGGRR